MQINKVLSGLGLFDGYIAQEAAKKKMFFFLDGYFSTRVCPNILLVAPKGCGKTKLAKELAKGLVLFDEQGNIQYKEDGVTPRKKQWVEVSCTSLKSVEQFINGFFIPHVQDKDVTMLFDEASEIPPKVTKFLLQLLNPTTEHRNVVVHEEYVLELDFRRATFIFATNEIQKVDPALEDRFERVDLEEYTLDQLGLMVQLNLKDVTFEPEALHKVATVLRSNGRDALKMSGKIQTWLKDRKAFKMADWEGMRDVLSIHPLGVSEIELSILRYLAKKPGGMSLTNLSSKMGMSTAALQKNCELYLMKNNLMEVTKKGREITQLGFTYLKALETKVEIQTPEDLKKFGAKAHTPTAKVARPVLVPATKKIVKAVDAAPVGRPVPKAMVEA